MVEPLRHRQTKGAETDMLGLPPPRHTSTLPLCRSPLLWRMTASGREASSLTLRQSRCGPCADFYGHRNRIRAAADPRADRAPTALGTIFCSAVLTTLLIWIAMPHQRLSPPVTGYHMSTARLRIANAGRSLPIKQGHRSVVAFGLFGRVGLDPVTTIPTPNDEHMRTRAEPPTHQLDPDPTAAVAIRPGESATYSQL